jgi:hypothetical protein
VHLGLAPPRARLDRLGGRFRLERGLLAGTVLALLGVALGVLSLWRWEREGWGDLDPVEQLRVAVPAGLFFTLGAMTCFASLLLSSIGMDKRLTFTHAAPTGHENHDALGGSENDRRLR